MGLSTIRQRSEDMLDGIKSRLGLTHERTYSRRSRDYDDYDGDYDDTSAEDGYDDYDDEGYDEYEYGEGYSDGSLHSSTTSLSHVGTTRSSALEVSSPRLVSIDDVRLSTQALDSSRPHKSSMTNEDSKASYQRKNRLFIDNTTPSPGSPESVARMQRSSGLDSLFGTSSSRVTDTGVGAFDEETTRSSAVPERAFGPAPGSPAARAAEGLTAAAVTDAVTLSSTAGSSFDPHAALAGTGTSGHKPTRGITVFRPRAYAEVERVAKVLRAGDVAVLSLKNTPESLATRVLDFSFGVACCVEARVDCIGVKTFVITRGAALSEAELASLKSQGVL